MKHDPEMIERVARAIADTQHTRYWEVWKETAQAALDAAFESDTSMCCPCCSFVGPLKDWLYTPPEED